MRVRQVRGREAGPGATRHDSTLAGPCLVIDAGRSWCRAALYVDGDPLGQPVTGPGLPDVAEGRGARSMSVALSALLRRLPLPGHALDAVCVGLTGVLEPGPGAAAVADAIHAAVATRQVLVTSDVVTGYCGAVGLSEGVVVAAGTGVITLAVGPLRVARVDGWGWILGDAGSGYDIGRRGLDAALRAHDGRGGSAALAELAARAIGPLDDLVRLVYGEANPVRLVAGFAEQVAAAARAGDPIARRIWADAAAELATSAVAAVDRAGLDLERIPLSWTGGLFSAEDLLLEPFLARATATRPALTPQAPAGTALEGAYRLATATPGGPLDALVYRAPAQPAGRDPENPEGVPR